MTSLSLFEQAFRRWLPWWSLALGLMTFLAILGLASIAWLGYGELKNHKGMTPVYQPILIERPGATNLGSPTAGLLGIFQFTSGSFEPGSDTQTTWEWRLDASYSEQKVRATLEEASLLLVVVSAGHDLVPLSEAARQQFGTNINLAFKRAVSAKAGATDHLKKLAGGRTAQIQWILIPHGVECHAVDRSASNSPRNDRFEVTSGGLGCSTARRATLTVLAFRKLEAMQ